MDNPVFFFFFVLETRNTTTQHYTTTTGGLYLCSCWNIIDIINYSLFLIGFIYWVLLLIQKSSLRSMLELKSGLCLFLDCSRPIKIYI